MGSDDDLAALFRAFVHPPDDARPRVWWHWMDGNVDPGGIRDDLEWMHAVGVRGAQLFDGGMGGPLVVPEAVRPGSAAWDLAVRTAVDTAAELGMELAVATSAGWSAAGGPWVAPRDAMKKVVWSTTELEGGGVREIALPALPDVAGAYQDAPRWGEDPARGRFAADWVVLAFPVDASHDVLVPDAVGAAAAIEDPSTLTDGSFAAGVALPRDPDAASTTWLAQRFDAPVTVRSVVVGLPGPTGFGAAPLPDAVLQCEVEGGWRDVVALPVTTAPVRTAAFAPVTSRAFRLVLSAGAAADALPRVSAGVRLPPVLRRVDAFTVTQFALRGAGRIDAAEAKAGFSVVADYFAVDTDPASALGAVDPDRVVDLTASVQEGVLRWNAPPGRWTVIRLGASLTGKTNGPALADATGLEVDKLDGARVAAYLDVYLERFGGEAGAGILALLSDSIESGPQNHTDRMLDAFRERRGYDARPWLPALTGLVVGDPAASDRFLYDWRRTIADLLADEYYGTLADEAHRRGMTYYAEALEDRRPQLGDDLAMRARSDVPMGAMWTFDPADGPAPTYVADLMGASSVAHVHGKAWTGSEAFTSFLEPWSWTPRELKHIADLQLALGVTRFCIHTSPHQPGSTPPPGLALAPFLGQTFTRNETWAAMARPWIDYLARCCAMLAAGEPAVEVAVFVGEEAPVTGLYGERFDTTVPDGYGYDHVGAQGLTLLEVLSDGRLRARGSTYRVLHLGGASGRMTLAALGEVERLLDAGATVVGRRPQGSPSLADDPAAVDAACDRIWGARTRGRLVATDELGAALAELGVRPQVEIEGAALRWIARRVDGRRMVFLANPSASPASAHVRLADAAGLQLWDPVAVTASAAPEAPDGRLLLALPAFGSVFVVGEAGDPPMPVVPAADGPAVELAGPWTLELPGLPSVDLAEPLLWTDVDAAARGFSGTAVYRTTADGMDAGDGRLALDLGDVRDIARVLVDGVDCGVAWTPPFRVDVTSAFGPGSHTLEVHVANPWRNRLIADAGAPTGEILAAMTTVFAPGAAVRPAGMSGPVRLVRDGTSPARRLSSALL